MVLLEFVVINLSQYLATKWTPGRVYCVPWTGKGNHVQTHKAELRSPPRTTPTDKPTPTNGQQRSGALDRPRTRGERDAHKLQELADSRSLKVQNWQVILYAYRKLKHTRDQCVNVLNFSYRCTGIVAVIIACEEFPSN